MNRVAVVALVAVLVGAGPAAAEGEANEKRQGLREAAAELAQKVARAADAAKLPAVRVGYFSPLGVDGGNAGMGVAVELAAALSAARVSVDPKAPAEVKGDYALIADPKHNGRKLIQITAELIVLKSPRPALITATTEVRVTGDIARLLGVTGTVPETPSAAEANRVLQAINDAPTAVLRSKTVVSPSQGSPFGVEIRTLPLAGVGRTRGADVKYTPTAKPVTLDGGKPFVPIEKGEVYEVRVFNYGPQEAAFTLSIDGIDQFAFTDDRAADGRPRYSHILVPPAKGDKPGETVVYGWHKTVAADKDNYLSFLVTDYGQGAAGRVPTAPQGAVGMIELGFCLSFPEGTARSRGETGFGPPGRQQMEVVKRVIDPPTAFLTIRYQR